MRLASLTLIGVFVVTASAQTKAPAHPLEALTTAEYWAIYDVLQKSGHTGPDAFFSSELLREPVKSAVLAWKPGDAIPREADVVMLQKGQTYEARVDIAGRKLVSWQEVKGAQAPFVTSEIFTTDEIIKKDSRIVEALNKRGITDLATVECITLPVAYASVPEQLTKRIGFGSCSQQHGSYHSWGRSIEGLTFEMDMVDKKIVKITDTGVVPVSDGAVNYEEIPEKVRAGATPIAISQPLGAAFAMKDGEIAWQNWHFRVRIDQRTGPVLNLVRFDDGAHVRSVLYEGSLSELYVPYMDPGNGWSNRVFIDAGEFFSSVGLSKPLQPGLDCPANAAYLDTLTANEHGAPKFTSKMACLFERTGNDPAWRHFEGNEVYGRPGHELVLRSAAVIGNYDYIIDWRFQQDGTIDVAVGATGVIETKASIEKDATAHPMDKSGSPMPMEYGQFVAEHTIGVNHDHYFSFRLDLDVDGQNNSFMADRLIPQKLNSDMRKSIWVVQPSIATCEKDAMMDIHLERPSMWLFMNPNVHGPLGYPTGYEVMAGVTAKSLMSADDLAQQLGGFSEHQFWVTPYDANQRYAAGIYPTSSKADDGLPAWTKANRPIENTDIVGWYTLGFHHMPRIEDWPVMPTMWHTFQIRPFNFFNTSPVMELPKSD